MNETPMNGGAWLYWSPRLRRFLALGCVAAAMLPHVALAKGPVVSATVTPILSVIRAVIGFLV